MIFYATKETIKRYNLKTVEEMTTSAKILAQRVVEREKVDRLLEWGIKLFYFEGRKCLQVMNFASKYTLFLIDINVKDISNVGDLIAHYMLDMYADDHKMIAMLKQMFAEHHTCVYDKLTDKSIISSLNNNQLGFAGDGDTFYDFFEDNILKTREINKEVNFNWLVTQMIDGKKTYIYSGERFKFLVYERYKER